MPRRRRHEDRRLRRDPEGRHDRPALQDFVAQLRVRGGHHRGRRVRRPRSDVHQRSVSACDRRGPAANRGRLDGGADARLPRRVDRQRSGDPVRRDDRGAGARRRRCGRDTRRPGRCHCGGRAGANAGAKPACGDGRGMIGIGVIGYGYWGPNLVRNFAECKGAAVRMVCDLRKEQLEKVERRYPGVRTTTSPADVWNDPAVDAVVIATPVQYHFELAMSALRAGKHVLVEKPMTSTSEQASRLIDEAASRRLVLMVDHTFVYTGAVRKMRELAESGDLGDIYYYDSVRINLGLFQHDVNVLWDLAVHDLSIMDFVLRQHPIAVSATGLAHVANRPENIAYMTMFFNS